MRQRAERAEARVRELEAALASRADDPRLAGSLTDQVGQGALAAAERLAKAADRLLTCLAEFPDDPTACAEYVDLLERRLTEFTPAGGDGVNQDESADWRAESPARRSDAYSHWQSVPTRCTGDGTACPIGSG